MNEEEFNKYIVSKRREISELKINEEEKQRLYSLVEETVQRYEDIKTEAKTRQMLFERGARAVEERDEANKRISLSIDELSQREAERKTSLLRWLSPPSD